MTETPMKNTYALTPPMGWNSYDYYDTTVTEDAVKKNADYMAAHLKDFGWEYIVVDIEWFAPHAGSRRKEYQYIPFNDLVMDEYSRLLPDPERFPSSANGKGFAPLGEYIHSLGLKFGIHIMRGIPREAAHRHMHIINGTDAAEIADPSSICKWNPDMYGVKDNADGQAYYDSLIELYASWGVDFIKCDDICNTNMYPHDPYSAKHEIEMLSKAISRSGRPIVLSLSPGPALIEQAEHYKEHANMWRITDDFWDEWRLLKEMFTRCEMWQEHVGVGCYPDCDMLTVGVIGGGFENGERTTALTADEQKTMLTLWCIFGSPLMIGSELTRMDSFTVSLLTNRDILSMLTPDLKPHQLRRTDTEAVWIKADGKIYDLAVFNLSDKEKKISVSKEELSKLLTASGYTQNIKDSYTEMWSGAKICTDANGTLSVSLKPHGCSALH